MTTTDETPRPMGSFRITPVASGFEAQMLWQCRGELIWVPLNPDGIWADPNATSGVIRVRHSFPNQEEAAEAILRAKKINARRDAPRAGG